MGLMSVAKLQVSLVRLVRSTMLESLPTCLFVGSRSQIRAHGLYSDQETFPLFRPRAPRHYEKCSLGRFVSVPPRGLVRGGVRLRRAAFSATSSATWRLQHPTFAGQQQYVRDASDYSTHKPASACVVFQFACHRIARRSTPEAGRRHQGMRLLRTKGAPQPRSAPHSTSRGFSQGNCSWTSALATGAY